MEPFVEQKNTVRRSIVLLCVVSVLLAGIVACFWLYGKKTPSERYCVELALLGEKTVTVEYGEGFTDPGAKATGYETAADGEHKDLQIQISGTVDLEKLGSYTLLYTAEYMGAKQTAERIVTVVDTKAPEIQLIENPNGFTLPGDVYEEEGFTATDLYDGDLTASVQRIEEDGIVTYTVADSSGNQARVKRQIRYHDPEAPVLTLLGGQSVTISLGETWTDPGYTAEDNVDGDITNRIRVSGEVNHTVAGSYTLTYQVTDAYGNTATAEREVIVEIPSESNGEKVIYLTFDDGPWEDTPRLLSVLEQYGAKATFFVVNTKYISLLEDIAAKGHSIGIHSKTHKYEKIYSSEDAFWEDFYEMQDIIYRYTGQITTISRFPGGSSNRVSMKYCTGIMTKLTGAVEKRGFRYYDWNVDSDDAGNAKTADQVFDNVIAGILEEKCPVVLMHDTFSYSVDAVERILQWGMANGYRFAALDENSPECQHDMIKN